VQLGRVLGRGNSSRVYFAKHVHTGKSLAIKVLQEEIEASRESRHQVLNEIKTVFNAKSDHLVAFYDAFHHEGAIYLALEFMDGGSLEGILSAAARTPAQCLLEPVAAHVLFQVLQGLTYLHKERHAVHRDLKPANILLNSQGFVKLSDFGISKSLDNTDAQAQTHCGTLAYMSPERIRGESYAFASDVWSVGLIALEMCCGGYPYPVSHNYFDLVKNIVEGPLPTEDPQVQARLAPDLLELVHASIAKDPNHRPDVLALISHRFIGRHQADPCDLRAYLCELAQYAQQPAEVQT